MTAKKTIEKLKGADPAPAQFLSAELGEDDIRAARRRVAEVASQLDAEPDAVIAPPRRKRGDLALGALALLALASLTPPVQAIAERVGELVGVGDEPTRTAIGPLDEPAIVIGAGRSPNGTPYEVVASADMNIYYDENPPTCIGLDLPKSDGPSHAGCLTHAHKQALARRALSPTAFLGPDELGAEQLIVDGIAHADVARVEIERVGDAGIETYPAELSRLDDELASEIGSPELAGFFLAFLPADLVPPFDPQPPPEDGQAPRERSVVGIPAPAPGSIAGDSPVITPESLEPPGPGEWADSPVEQALARLSVVAYDSEGNEIGRESLLRGPYSELILYSGLRHPELDARRRDELVEACFRETLRRYGELGEIKPQLPTEFGQELDECMNASGSGASR